ncbi:MAG: LptF/LptG family permease [Spirochaetes bacterium]|nr:LptF/LptG family permease [Spirochaetota bacterium]
MTGRFAHRFSAAARRLAHISRAAGAASLRFASWAAAALRALPGRFRAAARAIVGFLKNPPAPRELARAASERLRDFFAMAFRLRIIQGYILKESFGPFLVGTLFFTLVFALQKIGELVQLTMEKATPLSITLQLFLYMLPFTAAITVPMGVLFGMLATFGKLSTSSEIIAMRANRISLLSIFAPSALLGILVTIGLFWFINWVMPETNFRYKMLYKAVVYSNPGILLQDRVFTDLPHTDKKISTLGVSDDGKVMQSVFIYERDRAAGKVKLLYASTGEWLNNTLNSPLITLDLRRGRSLELGETNFDDIQHIVFQETALNIYNQVTKPDYNPNDKSPRELSVVDLIKVIRQREKAHVPVSPDLWIEYHKKYSIPAACLVFVFLGMPLGISFARSGRGISFGSAVLIIFIYYALMTLGETLGNKRIMDARLSMWLPNIILFIAGLAVFIKKGRE